MPACQSCTQQFEPTAKDQAYYKKIDVPKPTRCPQCRLQRRLSYRNERNLYKRPCDLCGKEGMAAFSEEKPFPVYCKECWLSDKWDRFQYGQDYDPKRPFFDQLKELTDKVPRTGLAVIDAENCDYCNYVAYCKNCYLCFGSVHCEDCMYGAPYESKDCVDVYLARECELCYECIDCERLYSCKYCQDCSGSSGLIGCYDCHGCENCIGCVGLRHKKFYIFNKPVSKEEFEKKKSQLGSREEVKKLLQEILELELKHPHRFARILNSENVTGNYIVSSRNANYCFDVKQVWDCSYCAHTIDARDSLDTNYCEHFELSYEHIGYCDNNGIKFSNTCNCCNEAEYADFCQSCRNIFGCISLKNASNIILNKQYSEEEYEKLRAQIISDMTARSEYGEFPPIKNSPFCYNESVAQEHFPLTREQALEQGYQWKDLEPRQESEAEDSIKCSSCPRSFKIIDREQKFYDQHSIPKPEKCPFCRHEDRLKQRNPRALWQRKCGKCQDEIYTAYNPDRPEMVYCEKCYLETVF
ncbi:MAG: zinc-ribbon domain containing protein [Patescibacteria group bacterium]|nr:zinc-ribbon domain-containing protein [Patescibacteria group bacterium]